MPNRDLLKIQLFIEKLKDPKTRNEGIKELYKNHYGSLHKMILNHGGSTEDAQDVIQETMISFIDIVLENKFRGDSQIQTFLYAIAKNIWLSKIRKTTAEQRRTDIWLNENEEFEEIIIGSIEKQEAFSFIMKTFADLGEICKKILTLYYYEEKSMKDMLSMLHFDNEQTLRNKKSKCMKSLNEKIIVDSELAKYLKNALKS